MRIDCFFTHQGCQDEDFAGRAVVAIDVLRATSSMITALTVRAKAIIPITEIADALALAQQMPAALLAGERDGDRLEGFDMGNSPLEFTRETVEGRVVIACTTNGTAAIQKARAAGQIWLGALLNAQAVAQKTLQEDVPSLAILCAGTEGSPSLDDIMAAGAILHHISKAIAIDIRDMNDAAVIALRLYESYIDMDMHQVLSLSRHGQKLIRVGRGQDVVYCAQQNISNIVPWLNPQTGCIYG